MPRPRKNDFSAILNPIVDHFSSQLAAVVEKFTTGRVVASTRASAPTRAGKSKQGRSGRPQKLCYYPRCKNIAAPRFGMFCAAKHKGLPDSAKAKYRAAKLDAST